MFKTIKEDFGVTIDLGNYRFIFSEKSHTLTDLGSSNVRITRKIDGLSEIFNTAISNFVDINGDAVATTFAELDTYLKTSVGGAQVASNKNNIATNANTIGILSGKVTTNKANTSAVDLKVTNLTNTVNDNNSLSLKLYSKFLMQYFRPDTSPVQYLGATMTCSYASTGRVIVRNTLGDNFPDNYIVNFQIYTNDREGDMVRRSLIISDTYTYQFTISSYDIPTNALLDSDARIMISIYYAEPA